MRLNLTIVDCKFTEYAEEASSKKGLNLTIVDCKSTDPTPSPSPRPSLNLTIVDCKSDFGGSKKNGTNVLISP